MPIDFVPFQDEDASAWTAFVDCCDEAWVYHTVDLIRSVPYDYSFSVRIDGEIRGVCAMGRVPRRRGAYLVGPGPALSNTAQTEQIYKALRRRIKTLALGAACQGVEFMLSPMAPANLARPFAGSTLDRCHFSDGGHWVRSWKHSPGYFSVLDLRSDPHKLISGFSKGHKASVNRCAKLGIALLVHTGPDASQNAWDAFVEIHGVTCRRRGDPPYADERYAHLFQLVKSGHMTLLNGMLENSCVVSVLLATYKNAAFYSYGGAHDSARQKGAMAWIQNEAIHWLASQGYSRYCLGFTIAALEGTYEGGVGDFKKRFGGERWPMLCGDMVAAPFAYFIWQVLPDFVRFCVLNRLGIKRRRLLAFAAPHPKS